MDLIGEGLFWGLVLTIMVGPIMIGIVQTSIEKGFKSGLRFGGGIWISDFLFIIICYWFTKPLDVLVQKPAFTFWLGVVGGLVLATIGIGMLTQKDTRESLQEKFTEAQENKIASWTKGFLVNTINPFTFIFWITISITIVATEAKVFQQAFAFYASIMVVIILGDTAKVFMANRIRPWLTPSHVNNIRLISGVAFIIFGIVMVIRVYNL